MEEPKKGPTPLAFFERMTPRQWEAAAMAGEMAKKYGVPPRLAIAIAMRESSLNPNVADGSAGEIGMMQVKPGTAESMGYSAKDLRIPEKNLEIGIKYLKQNLDAFDNDARLAAAGYNAGTARIQSGVIPETTKNYLLALNEWRTFEDAAPAAPAEKAAPGETSAAAPAEDEAIDLDAVDKSGRVPFDESLTPGEEEIPNLSVIRNQNREMGGIYGAGAGAAAGAALGAAKLGASAVKGLSQMRSPSPQDIAAAVMKAGAAPQGGPASPLPTSAPGTPPAPPGAPSAPVGGPSAPAGPAPEGGYPRATGPGSATFNWGRAFGLPEIEAAQALNTTKEPGGAQDLLNKRAAALQRIQAQFPSGSFAENPAFGGIMTPSASVGSGPKASFVMQPPEAPTPEAPAGSTGGLRSVPVTKPVPTVRLETKTAGALESLTRSFIEPFEKIGANVATVAKPVVGALSRVGLPAAAGYSIGKDIADISDEYYNRPAGYQPNKTNIGLSALGALGTGVSLVAPLSPLGLPLAVGAPTARYIKDRYQEVQANPKAYEETMQRALSNVDPMGNPLQ